MSVFLSTIIVEEVISFLKKRTLATMATRIMLPENVN